MNTPIASTGCRQQVSCKTNCRLVKTPLRSNLPSLHVPTVCLVTRMPHHHQRVSQGQRIVTASASVVDGRSVRPDSNNKAKDSTGASPTGVKNCRIYTTEGTNSNLEVVLSFIGADGYEVGSPVDFSKFSKIPWVVEGEADPIGVIFEGPAPVPEGADDELIVLRMKSKAKAEKEYINKIEIKQGNFSCRVAPNSWIHKAQGGRMFFANQLAYLPQDTPAPLKEWRQDELAEIRGTKAQRALRREDWDRIYDYDVYNDLAGTTMDRNILGGPEHPYPRRMRTGRAYVPGAPVDPKDPSGPKKVYETRETDTGTFWTPLDERFNLIKQTNFKAYALLGAIPTTAEALRRKLDWDKKMSSFDEVNTMYSKLYDPNLNLSNSEVVDAMKSDEGKMKDRDLKIFGINPDDMKLALPILSAISSSVQSIKDMVGGIKGLLAFPPPLVVQNRKDAWRTDEEWGRQALAGVNPSSIVAVTSRDMLGSMITDEQLQASTEGHSVASLIAQAKTDPRLLVVDHMAVFDHYAPLINEREDREGYWGRAVVYRRNDDLWVPIAIELHNVDYADVYTPKDHPNLWLLAKGVFNSVDSGFHQLVTHWLRTHACTEPYIIATHRQLSSLHPIYKLMVPHWAFTMQINANARSSLINGEGIIESTFTPHRWAIEMSSAVYGALWQFNKEGLPMDLEARGLAAKQADGKTKILLKDYPYGDDGMLLWEALDKWVGQYLALYYDDSDANKQVTADPELMAWWNEIVHTGHQDKKDGWPELKTTADLKHILCTMIWIVSGHHAAINYSQYAYTGYVLNRPNLCRKKIPARGTPEFQALVKDTKGGERAYLDTLFEPGSIKSVLTVELLSTHADNEVYIGDPAHAYILDENALELYSQFVQDVKNIEKTVKERNADKSRKVRSQLPYEFLRPTSKTGITNRGVPNSICI